MEEKLPVYDDRTPVFADAGEKKKALGLIAKITDSMQFFAARIQDCNADRTDVHTHMGLSESYFAELSALAGYDGMLKEEMERRHETERSLRMEIRRLEREVGKQQGPDALSGGLSWYEKVFGAWYESKHFHFASMSFSVNGIHADFSDDLDYDMGHIYLDQELMSVIPDDMSILSEWDVDKFHYHAGLMDTDANRKRIMDLYSGSFPDARVISFRSRENDNHNFGMRHEVYVPYRDIAELERRMRENGKDPVRMDETE